MNTMRRAKTISQVTTWAMLAHNYVANPNLSKLLSHDNPRQRQFILHSLDEQYTEMAHLFSKLCR